MGIPGEPTAKLIKLCWVILSPGREDVQLISCLLRRLCMTMKSYVV